MIKPVNRLRLKLLLIIAFFFSVISITGCNNSYTTGLTVYPVFNNSAANSYIAADKGEAVVIDPSDPEAIIKILTQKGLKPRFIILTHGHFDHILGLSSLVKRFPNAKVLIHALDADKLSDPEKNLSYQFGTPVKALVKSSSVTEKNIIKIGNTEIKVIETPGHTQGSIILLTESSLFTGDTLFRGSIGRTDFPGSSSKELAESLKKIVSLPGDLTVYPGHGDFTTLWDEKSTNPYLKEID